MSASRYLDWQLALIFTVLGPFVAVMLMLASVALSGEASSNLGLFGIFLAWTYLFGVVPAAATGLLLPPFLHLVPPKYRGSSWPQFVLAPVLGFTVSWLLFAALTPFSAVRLAALGALSALVCSATCRVLRVGPNNSSKPTPLRGAA